MGLIAHYRLDGDATDAVGNNHGTASNVTWADGKLGICADSTGSNSAFIMGAIGWKITREFSFSIWAKRDGTDGSSFGGLISTHSHSPAPTAGVTLNIRNTSNAVSVAAGDGSVRPSYTVTVPDPVTEWCHYVLTFKNNVFSVYQNGKLVDSRSSPVAQINHDISRGWVIGRWATSYTTYNFVGYLDDARVYDHALSPREVRDLSLGMVGHYPLRRDAINAAGYDSGSLHGSVVFSDVMGGSAEFDNSSYIQLETGITGDPDELSASFWAKTDALQTYDGLLQFDGVSDYEDGFVITGASSTSMRLRHWSDGGTDTTWPAGDFATGKETHFCVTLKDNLFTVYQDGEKVGEHTYTNPLNLSGGVKLGLYSWSSNYFTGWIKDARIYATALTDAQVKELYQQRASLDSEGSVHTQLVLQSPRARYIRDWTNGSTSNNGNHWLEVRAVYAGENISLGKPVTAISGGSNLSKVTDGDISNSGYAQTSRGIPAWVQVDLGEVREIDEVQVWHYNSDGRTYYDTKTEISEDGINWTTIFDSAISGTYKETSAGITHTARALEPFSVSEQGIKAPDVSEVGVSRGLVAWYPLIGDTKDYAGTIHAVNSGAVATAEGYEFDGVDDELTRPIFSEITEDGTYTFSCFIYWHGDTGITGHNHQSIFVNCHGSYDRNGLTLTQSGTLGFQSHSNSGYNGVIYSGIVPDVPVHVAAVSNMGNKSLFINGVPVGQSGNNYQWVASGFHISLNAVRTNGYGPFNGIIRDVRIHNVALTPEEVAIQAKLSLNQKSKVLVTENCLYTAGQIKEVIA